MLAHTASRTALGAAMLRAAHQLVDRPPLLADPLALRILGDAGEAQLRSDGERWTGAAASALRAFIAVRSRVAEDSFAAAHARGVRSYVVVGAGLDTFAYRTQLAGVRVIEIDHPATQADKRARLAAAAIAIPDGVSYAPVDFEHETLRDGLARAGLGDEPAVFAWLGVTPYLSHAALTQTLRDLAAAAPGSELVFDFAAPATGDHASGRERLAARVGALGEPLRSELDPDALADELRGHGFSRVEIADHAALAARYFTDRRDGLRLRGGHIARAWV